MATQRPVHIDSTSGNVRELVAGDKLGGVTGGTATGEVLTFDQRGSVVQAYDADLAAIAGLSTGLVAITGAGTAAARTITGTASQVTVTNGNGVSGNPTLSLPQSIDTAATVRFGSLGVGMVPTYLVDILSPTLTDFGTEWAIRSRAPSSCTVSASNFLLAFDMAVSDMSVSAGVTDSGYRMGVRGDAFAGAAGFAGTLATQYGVLGRAGINSATAGAVVTNAYALSAEILNSVAGTTITNGIGLRVVNTGTTGTMTNRWGVYVDTATGGKNYFSHAVGVGSTTISAQIHAISTTEQLRLGYDASNYLSTTVSSSGAATLATTGTNASITLTPTGTGNVILSTIPRFNGTNSTGAGSSLLGANSPAATLTAPYTWISVITSDGSTCYCPVWK